MWKFKLPVEIIFGEKSREKLSEIADNFGKNKIIVTDPVLAKLEIIQEIIKSIPGCKVFCEVRPNPTIENVDTLTEIIRKENIEVLIAVGGGSALDCAKAASCLAKTSDNTIRKYHSEGKVFGKSHLPIIAVPTTAGTGSEVTPFAVLDDPEKNFKGPIASDSFYPTVAVVDPELTYSLPKNITASTALDALSHAIEGYWSKNHQPICDVLAKEAAKTIFSNLEKVLKEPNHKEGRKALSYAALIAGMAFQLPKNAIIHACSYPLSNRFHMPHGVACAFVMEEAIKLNAPYMGKRMEEFLYACGFKKVEEMIDAITYLKKLGGLPCSLKEAGISEENIDLLVKESFHPLINNNPKKVTEEDIRNIYNALARR